MAVTRTWRVYGADGHRQRQSFFESVKWDWSNEREGTRIFEASNYDRTRTHDYSLIRITRDTYEERERELWGQISDGYFENSRTGKVIEVPERKYMNKYLITYSRDGEKEMKAIRRAYSPCEAIEKLTDQYKWRWALSLIDADTNGKEWASGYVDTYGGINYNMRILAELQ